MVKSKTKSGRKYSAKASEDIGRAMHKMKRGSLRSGRSGWKVTRRQQAIAIGLSEARREGAKVPRRAARSTAAAKRKGRRKKKSS